jgi:hypothetical protein
MAEASLDSLDNWHALVRRATWGIRVCEQRLGIECPKDRLAQLDWVSRLDRVLRAALPGGLDARCYRWAWNFRRGLKELGY